MSETHIVKIKNSKKGIWISQGIDIREVPHNPKSRLLAKVFPVRVEFYDSTVRFKGIKIDYEVENP